MPLCGFNKKMLQGMSGFQSGLVEHGILLRSKNKNQTFQETIKKELDDMDRFQKEIHGIKDPEIRELTRALTEYACAFYKLVQKRGIEKEVYIQGDTNLTTGHFIESIETLNFLEISSI